MNRAWIPAGALAGVSVAGLIALGPLTNSLTQQPSFPSAVTVSVPQTPPKALPVSYSRRGAVGNIEHAALKVSRAGRQPARAATSVRSLSRSRRSQPHRRRKRRLRRRRPHPQSRKKKAAKRPATIGGVSGPNSDAGLAGSNPNGSTHNGDLQSTPGSDTP